MNLCVASKTQRKTQMEIVVVPCTSSSFPSKLLSQKLPTEQNYKISFLKTTTDSHLKHLSLHGKLTEAISSLDSIIDCGSTVRPSTLSLLIQSFTDSHSLSLCYQLHSRLTKLLKHPDPYLENKLVSMYAKCGSLDHAFKVFDKMPQKNLYTWSAIIGACSREKKWSRVVELFYGMMLEGEVVPDEFLFPKILQACGNCGDVETGRLIHSIAVKRGMSGEIRVNNSILAVYAKCRWLDSAEKFFRGMEVIDSVSWNAIIKGYCQAGKMKEARGFLELMPEPDVITWNILISGCIQSGKCDVALKLISEMQSSGINPDVFTWTSMISGFAHNNRRVEALKLFRDMVLGGVEPNEVAFMSAISACSSLKDFGRGKEIHLLAIKLGFGDNVLVGNSLIDMYSKCGKLDAAREVFDIISVKDVYTWNSMIGGYCQAGYYGLAHDLFKQMQESDVSPNSVTWNVMITGYFQNREEDRAMDLFNRMENNGGVKRDTASWNAIIAGYFHQEQKNKALKIFKQMQSLSVKPNSVTILSILPACSNLIAAKKLKEIHCCVLRRNLESECSVANSLIDTYAKAGNIKYSKAIFDGMPSKDTITWNTMISGYVAHGCAKHAIKLFECMREQGIRPNRGTFASTILAYGQAKLVDEGRHVYEIMTEEYKILPCLDHCVAMVHLYGRSGNLDEAFDFIGSMSIKPDVSVWSALLTACRRHGNVKLAIHAAEMMIELEPENLLIQKLVIQLYDLRGVSKDLMKIKRPGIKKDHAEYVPWSCIEDNNIVHNFVTGNYSLVHGQSLHSWIRSIEVKSKASKYRDMLFVQEEEKEEETGVIHSEKVALGFTLINSHRTPKSIRIVKNSSMCERCHRFAQLVSKTYGCEIYLSDSKGLHHFKGGICSCGDYW